MIGPAQRLISGVDTISQNFKEKQIDYHQWDINALVVAATIAIALTALMVPLLYQLWGQSPVSLQKTSTKAYTFPAEVEPPLCNHRMTNPWWSPSSGAWNNVELFKSPKILLPQKCNGRGTLPQASQGLLKGPCSLEPCDLACWVLSLLGRGSVGQKGILGKERDSGERSTSCFLWTC